MGNSLATEEIIGAGKNGLASRQAKNFSKPETSMGLVISTGVVNTHHHYELMENDVPVSRNNARLGTEAFAKYGHHMKIDTSEVVTTQ